MMKREKEKNIYYFLPNLYIYLKKTNKGEKK